VRKPGALSNTAIWTGAVVIAVVAIGSAWLLLANYGSGDSQDNAHLEAIKTAGSIVVGTGGAVALLLAARRQRSTELDLEQKERVAADARHDATERRITDLYTKAAEQLGSDKAPVRLAGLYALERLAQDAPDHRQTVVDVFCAYLRMPSADPRSPELAEAQEQQVRTTAQRILIAHLLPGDAKFWPDTDLDLRGAKLHDWHLVDREVRRMICTRTEFIGTARFRNTHFTGEARFVYAKFGSLAEFKGARFDGLATFENAEFADAVEFAGARAKPVLPGTAPVWPSEHAWPSGWTTEDSVLKRQPIPDE
jgi:hypothetical protein